MDSAASAGLAFGRAVDSVASAGLALGRAGDSVVPRRVGWRAAEPIVGGAALAGWGAV
ncbi:MAG TPA: hypothetical protein VNY52_04530 [Solirubrobacteraceae bacterium]|nr:hypothetical protein [Solirubrobacteraceae bacterium]